MLTLRPYQQAAVDAVYDYLRQHDDNPCVVIPTAGGKMHPVLGRKDYLGNHEWCFYGWREGAAHQFFGPTNAVDVWEVKKVSPQKMIHLTEKPVELAQRAIQYSSRSGENVLDLFGGSGSTLIAAEQTGRNAFLMEIDPLYCDVIVQRFETFSGRKAERLAADIPMPIADAEPIQ